MIPELFYREIAVVGLDRVPESGPLLILGSHRNGKMDAWIYRKVFPKIRFVVPEEWHATWGGRRSFRGIALTTPREENPAPEPNLKEILRIYDGWTEGAAHLLFPESGARLSSKHAPFKEGAAKLAMQYAETHPQGPELSVLPVEIHYEAKKNFRSRVEVAVGEPVRVNMSKYGKSSGRLKQLRHDLVKARQAVALHPEGDPHATGERTRFLRQLTLISRESPPLHRFQPEKPYASPEREERPPVEIPHLEPGFLETFHDLEGTLPHDLERFAESFFQKASASRSALYQGVPFFEEPDPPFNTIFFFVFGAVVALGTLLFFPALLAAALAGERLAEQPSRCAEAKAIAGGVFGLLWLGIMLLAALIVLQHPGPLSVGALGLFLLTKSAVRLYDPFKRLWVSARNNLFAPELRSDFMALRRRLAEFRERHR